MNETIEIDAESTTGDTSSKPDFGSTDATRRRYQRIASIYDVMKGMAEIRYRPWRKSYGRWFQVYTCWKQGLGRARTCHIIRQVSQLLLLT